MHHVDWAVILPALARRHGAAAAEGGGGGAVLDGLDHWAGIERAGEVAAPLYSNRTLAFSIGGSFAVLRRGDLKLMAGVANNTWYDTGYEWDAVRLSPDDETHLNTTARFDRLQTAMTLNAQAFGMAAKLRAEASVTNVTIRLRWACAPLQRAALQAARLWAAAWPLRGLGKGRRAG